jgi:hypothetical protein
MQAGKGGAPQAPSDNGKVSLPLQSTRWRTHASVLVASTHGLT